MPEGTKPLLQSNGSQARFNMAKSVENQRRKRVLVVGAGAAGGKDQDDKRNIAQADNSVQACPALTTSPSTQTNSMLPS